MVVLFICNLYWFKRLMLTCKSYLLHDNFAQSRKKNTNTKGINCLFPGMFICNNSVRS